MVQAAFLAPCSIDPQPNFTEVMELTHTTQAEQTTQPQIFDSNPFYLN